VRHLCGQSCQFFVNNLERCKGKFANLALATFQSYRLRRGNLAKAGVPPDRTERGSESSRNDREKEAGAEARGINFAGSGRAGREVDEADETVKAGASRVVVRVGIGIVWGCGIPGKKGRHLKLSFRLLGESLVKILTYISSRE